MRKEEFKKRKEEIKRIIFAGFWIALGVAIPQVFHLAGLGPFFSPMHLPVLLCGLLMGWKYGFLVGLITPFLNGLFTGMPPFPINVFMAAELSTYGLVIGFCSTLLKVTKFRLINIYFSLIIAMILGRLVYALILCGFTQTTLMAAILGVTVEAWPAIVLQIVLIPPLATLVERYPIWQ